MSGVVVVIPQFQQAGLTRECIAALRRCEGRRWSVLVVDDGSDVGERDLRGWGGLAGEGVRFLSVRHRGVTAAWNAGITVADAEFLVLANNDVVWNGPVLEALLEPLRQGRCLVSGVEWRRERCLPASLARTAASTRFVAGWCWAFSKQTWRDLRGFDSRLELYFSDTDFQWRLQQSELARKVPTPLVVQRLPIVHLQHQTAHRLPDQRRQWERDHQRFQEKWS